MALGVIVHSPLLFLLTVNVEWKIGEQIVGTSLIMLLCQYLDNSIVQDGIEKNPNEFSKLSHFLK